MTLRDMFTNAPVAGIILVATIAVSYWALNKNRDLFDKMLLHPWSVAREGKYHLLLTHGFIHADYVHLAINMLTFYFFAFQLEMIVGHLNFFLIYFGALVISGIISTIKRKDFDDFYSLGASGAISGMLFSFILFYPNAQLFIFFILPMQAWLFAILFIAVSYYAAKNRYSVIDHEGHLWGAISGGVITILLEPGVISIFFEQLFS